MTKKGRFYDSVYSIVMIFLLIHDKKNTIWRLYFNTTVFLKNGIVNLKIDWLFYKHKGYKNHFVANWLVN